MSRSASLPALRRPWYQCRLVGEVIAFAEIVRRRRRRLAREQHALCVEILERSAEAARRELVAAPISERWIRAARLRKLEDLHAYAAMIA